MRERIKLYIVVLILPLMMFGQRKMWYDYGPSDYSYSFCYRLSIDSLHSIIQKKSYDYSLPVGAYEDAVEYLYYKHKNSQKEFLLENLNTRIDTTLSLPFALFNWERYYTDAYILGLLGDKNAVSKMDTVARYGYDFLKEMAIANLAAIGKYDYYDYVKGKYEAGNKSMLYHLALYGEDSRYRNEVESIIEDSLNSLDPEDWIDVTNLTDYLGYFDGELELEKLNEYFYSTSDSTRHYYFIHLQSVDKEGQPERSEYGLIHEDDDFYRSYYLPNIYSIESGLITKRYLEPEYIDFLLSQKNIESETRTYKDLNFFIQEFEPAEPDSEATSAEMLEHLDSLIESSYNYNWLADETYKTSLEEKVETAEGYLSSSDELNAAREIKRFQLSVEQVHSDSSGSYPKYVSDVGYKFLYYYSQYILDRLDAEMP